jgi:peptidylprolyl isomerase
MKSSALLLAAASFALIGAQGAERPATPNDVVAAAPASAWRTIDPDDLLVIDMNSGNRVVIQLAPEFAPAHVANIRALARAGWWDKAAVYRVQDNYVAQWGLNETEKPFPAGVAAPPPHEYWRPIGNLAIRPLGHRDSYAPEAGFALGWPVAYDRTNDRVNLTHCYGSVGVARDLAPDTGSGSELYAIIGHAPRQLDRNIAVVGRVVAGIEHLSSLKRGPAPLGVYTDRSSDVPIRAIRLASQMPEAERPKFEFFDPSSAAFESYAALRANRNDPFYRVAAGGVDVCNVQIPVRAKPAG